MIEILNPHVIKIIISARKQDSIISVSKRIKLSYGWTHYWVKKLIGIGVFRIKKSRLLLKENNEFYKKTLKFVSENFSDKIDFNYNILPLFGIKYCFTLTDAVFIWTNGGYNISRYKHYYPIFIKLRKQDLELFRFYCGKLDLKINGNKGIFYSVNLVEDFNVFYNNVIPVDSLEETIKFMEKNIFNFQPALEMVKEIYGKNIKVDYKEAITNA